MIIKRGDIFLADLSPVMGSEQGGTRPVLIIQNDVGNRFSPTIIVAAITSQIQKAKLPTHVELDATKFNLSMDSVVLLEQIRTIDKIRLKEKLTSVANDEIVMQAISEAYQISGGIFTFDNSIVESIKKNYVYNLNEELNIIEDLEYEFKEIKGKNPKSSVGSNVSVYATSFLNSNGGRILYGITDDRVVKGFEANAGQIDEIKRVIYDSLRTIDPPLSADHYQINFHPVYEMGKQITNLYVLEVVVPTGFDKKAIYFHNGKEIHIRINGVKHNLRGNEIITFIQKKLSI